MTSYLVGWERHHDRRDARGRLSAASSAEEIEEHLSKGAYWARKSVDASDEQRTKTNRILVEASPEVFKFQSQSRELASQLMDAASGEEIDYEKVAELRQTGRKLAGETTDQTIDALVKIAEVLTPEQRRELAEIWRRKR